MSLTSTYETATAQKVVKDEELVIRKGIEQCFHGFISKKEAETRILECGIEGSVLVRAEEANSSKQKFYLSWLSPVTHIVLHYPITVVCGNYFLFGHRYSSLFDVVKDFTDRSKLPFSPVRPPSPIELTSRQRISLYPFNALADSDELSFCEGELLTEIQQVDEKWIWARLERTSQTGLVAADLTLLLNDKRISPETLPYFYEEPLESLAHLLDTSGAGSYLLRRSHNQPDCYALMLNSGSRIEKFLISRTVEGDYELGGRVFATIPDIVERYSKKEICVGNKLIKAVIRDQKLNSKEAAAKADIEELRHLSCDSSCPQPLATTEAFRRHKEDKWKDCFLMLSDTNGSQLFLFDSQKRAKPRMVLDLYCCLVYKVDESIVERTNCLVIKADGPEPSFALYLSFYLYSTFLRWYSMVNSRCRCSSYVCSISCGASNAFAQTSSFVYLTIHGYRGVNLKAENGYSICILINGVVVNRTRPTVAALRGGVRVLFDEPFIIDNVPSGQCSLELQLCSHNLLKGRTQLLKESALRDSSSVYQISEDGIEMIVPKNMEDDDDDGFMFRVVRYRLVILPEDQYSAFSVLLTSKSFALCKWMASVLNGFNRSNFARLLLLVFLPDYSVLFSFIDELLDSQLELESELTLLRGESFCACCISTALRIIGRDMIVQELTPLLHQLQTEKGFNINPEAFMRSLRTLVSRLPPLFGAVLGCVARACRSRFPNDLNVGRRAVGSFFVLRFINPILTLWSMNGGPSRQLAKHVQNAANQACSSDFDPASVSETVYIMADLLETLATTCRVEDQSENPFNGYATKEYLAVLAFQVEKVLEQRLKECPLSEASAVIGLLKSHIERLSK